MKFRLYKYFILLLTGIIIFACNNPFYSRAGDTEIEIVEPQTTKYFTILFQANGGTPVPETQIIEEGAKVTKVPAMSKSGYGFGGWYTEAEFTSLWDFAIDTVNSDLTLYAKWDSNFNTVFFEANGGQPVPENQNLPQGTRIIEPLPMTKEGHSFGGWYKDSSLTYQWDFYDDTMGENDMYLYARWEQLQCLVTFNTNGGSPAVESQNLIWGAKVVEPPAMNKDGYGFGGWYREPGLANEWNFVMDTINDDIILYAKWDAIYHTVTFNAGSGTPVPEDQNIADGSLAVRPPAMNREGYGFGGWYTDTEFTLLWDFTTDTVNTDISLYAKWDFNYKTVLFVANGGIPAPIIQAVIPGTKIVEPLHMRRPGYSFGGWYRDPDLIEQWDFYNGIMPDEDIALYAKWDELHCSVTFNADGGIPTPENQDLIWNTKVVEPQAMIKEGHSFGGWYKEPDFTNPWNFALDKVNTDITLYAKWNVIDYTVTFVANNGNSVGNLTVSYGALLTKPSDPVFTGNIFAGWFKEADFINEWNFNTDTLTGNLTLYAKWTTNVIYIPGGAFMMGTRNTEVYKLADETPQHQAAVGNFYMGRYPVTQAQYAMIMGINPASFREDTNRPVEMVSWYDAVEFCIKLSIYEGLTPVYTMTGRSPAQGYPIIAATITADFSKNGYRLPTEAEWEYACRGDYPNKASETATLPFGIGDGTKMAGGLANFLVNHSFDSAAGKLDYNDSSSTSVDATTPVGTYPANNYGLYDMHGNVWEWCWDWFNQTFYGSVEASLIDTKGPSYSTPLNERAMRGGSWNNRGYAQRSAYRNGSAPSNRSDMMGFRVVRSY